MSEGKLVPGDEHPLAAVIRKALGVGPYDDVDVAFPQFDRDDGKVVTFVPDKNPQFFDQLKRAPESVLTDIGMCPWNENLLLFPCEWYDFIPEGYVVTDIFGNEEPFKHGDSDSCRRFGCLSYGFRRSVCETAPSAGDGKSQGEAK